jgi:hypothetical protein
MAQRSIPHPELAAESNPEDAAPVRRRQASGAREATKAAEKRAREAEFVVEAIETLHSVGHVYVEDASGDAEELDRARAKALDWLEVLVSR